MIQNIHLLTIKIFEVNQMTFLYNNSHENEHLISELENPNGNANIANLASNEISLLNAIASLSM